MSWGEMLPIIATVAAEDLGRWFPLVLATHAEVRGLSPEEARVFEGVAAEHSRTEGFRLVVAVDSVDRVVGYAYGFAGGPGQAVTDEMAEVIGPSRSAEWLKGPFVFAQFGVLEHARREGMGTRLYHELFDGLAHDRAVLTVRVGSQPAISFYRANGWEVLHEDFVTAAGHGPYLIMGKRFGG
ncbi:MAG: GNAT family N-acetyltransferase [Acidimicrobiia bacterium]|nr:GNAT family N-acetyltransferase [Acidimicrobiia bacterium]MBT8246339.1 GNAT family N-acetyltransferase [Acidimicrobiia bacterium]NNF88849.1 GNAT family N-acetyltransferase [Acidimicrobiia bacterium]NNJ47816.1 GNAT family N-acetyltransferase [Acidimicrobiia bacterium]NNL14129.1 GNAT family N-acetyltransferase [Acidimicrobiia bacterium]